MSFGFGGRNKRPVSILGKQNQAVCQRVLKSFVQCLRKIETLVLSAKLNSFRDLPKTDRQAYALHESVIFWKHSEKRNVMLLNFPSL
jgi:hypothetical protein